MNTVVWILSLIASILSIYIFVYSILNDESWKKKILWVFVAITVVALCLVCRLYINKIDKERQYIIRQEQMAEESRKLVKELSSKISYWVPGQNEGVVMSVSFFLEKYKDIYPDAYVRYLNIIDARIVLDRDSVDTQEYRQSMEASAQQAILILKSIAIE